MTEEVKTCDCKEKAIQKLKEFAFITGAVFLGALLAILLSANILKPKCPPCHKGMMGPYPGIERQLPPPGMMNHADRGHYGRDFRGPQAERRQFREYQNHKDMKGFNPKTDAARRPAKGIPAPQKDIQTPQAKK